MHLLLAIFCKNEEKKVTHNFSKDCVYNYMKYTSWSTCFIGKHDVLFVQKTQSERNEKLFPSNR